MNNLPLKSENLKNLIAVLPLDDTIRETMISALDQDLSEETLRNVAEALKAQMKTFRDVAELLDIQREIRLSELEARAIELAEENQE